MRLAIKIIGGLLGLWVVVTGVLLAMNWSLAQQLWRFSPVVMPAFYGEPADRAEAQAQDIRYLRGVLRYDRSFSEVDQETFNAHLDAMAASAGQMSDAEFYLNVRMAMAISGNGHTSGPTAPSFRDFKRAGADFFWFADGLYIVRAHKSRTDLVGGRVVEIEGRTPEEINEALDAYTGGAASWRRLSSLYFLRSTELMHAAGLADAPDLLRIKIVDRNGVERSALLDALPAPKELAGYYRRPHLTLSAEALPEEADDWTRTLSPTNDLPLYLQSLDKNFYRAELGPEIGNGIYLRSSLLLDRKGASITEALQTVLNDAPDGGYAFMIIDLRWNPGGNFDTVVDFAKGVDAIVNENGKIYVIVGPQTFSAAIVFSALLKRYAPEKAVLVGEPMGDYGQFWAETGLPFELPNSGYGVNYATGYHDWEHGCTGVHKYCFTRNAAHEGPIGSLAPEKLIAPTYADYARGDDIVLNWIVQDAQRLKTD